MLSHAQLLAGKLVEREEEELRYEERIKEGGWAASDVGAINACLVRNCVVPMSSQACLAGRDIQSAIVPHTHMTLQTKSHVAAVGAARLVYPGHGYFTRTLPKFSGRRFHPFCDKGSKNPTATLPPPPPVSVMRAA